jgi:hypothetical protein
MPRSFAADNLLLTNGPKMNEGVESFQSAEAPAVELQNLRKAFEDHRRQLAEKDAEIKQLKGEYEVMRKFFLAACSARDRMSEANNQLRYLITELTNAAQTAQGVPLWLMERARELSKKFDS